MLVVNFDHHLSASHSKPWSKSAFSTFFVQKTEEKRKSKKFEAKFSKTTGFFKFTPEHWSMVLFSKKHVKIYNKSSPKDCQVLCEFFHQVLRVL